MSKKFTDIEIDLSESDTPTLTSNDAARMIITAQKQERAKWIAAIGEIESEVDFNNLSLSFVGGFNEALKLLLAKMEATQ